MSSIAKVCSIENCERNRETKKGWCLMHYKRWTRLGNPNAKVKTLGHHNMTGTPEHRTWKAIKRRCYSINNPRYADYGGRGITVCERWRNSFLAFYEDMGKRPSDEHSIERKNNDKGYSPENCTWATREEQMLNRRMDSRNTSGYRGVHYRKDRQKWVSTIRVNYRTYILGNYIDIEEAAYVYDQVVLQLYGEKAHPNFVD